MLLKNIQVAHQELIQSAQKTCNKWSVEVCAKKDLNLHLLSLIRPNFCSITWRVKSELDYRQNVEKSAPLILAETLCQNGYKVILHLPGKHFCKDEVLRILETAKSIGVSGIFAVQGG